MSLNVWIFGLSSLLLGSAAVLSTVDVRLPGNHRGYEPTQPIAFSHRLHAGELGMDCQFCHYGARSSRHAGVPPASLCMNCHRTVTTNLDELQVEKALAESEGREPRTIVSPELAKLYAALGLGDDLQPDPDAQPHPIEWVRVHNMPDFVYFDHRVHTARGIACETCHGPVQSMEHMRQESSLSMGWCLDCHRTNAAEPGGGGAAKPSQERVEDHVSTNCATCHL
jgi:hypothetical protein